jgi:hypothetical protein
LVVSYPQDWLGGATPRGHQVRAKSVRQVSIRLRSCLWMRSNSLVAAPFVLVAWCLLAFPVTGAAASFDPGPWLDDLDQVRGALATKYANLEWAVLERELDLPALFADSRMRLQSVTSEADARSVFDRLTRQIGDRHVKIGWPGALFLDADEHLLADCTALGYDARKSAAPVVSHVIGYRPIVPSTGTEFPTGMIQVSGRSVGVVKIGLFSPTGFPELCVAALKALSIEPNAPCDAACQARIGVWASDRMTQDLADQIRGLREAGARILLVDIAGNGGGSEWAEAAARLVSPIRLRSHRVGFVRGPHWAERFARTEAELKVAEQRADPADRPLLHELAAQVAERRRMAESPCDSGPLWRREPMPCRWLGTGFFGSSLLDSADPATLNGKPWASLVFSPAQYPYAEGIWRGPLIILVDGGTGSAAEEFTALLQDDRAAVILGAPTAGAGCGYTDGGTPTRLKNSGGVLWVPDCARFRADGSNEVMGIQPDILVGLRSEDGPHRAALRVAAALPDAIRRALHHRP